MPWLRRPQIRLSLPSMTIQPRDKLLGVILAGGQSRRMFGDGADGADQTGDKTLLDLGGQTVLRRIIDRVRPQVGQLVLNTNGNAARFNAFDLPVIGDSLDGFQGPLAGVLAGLQWASAHAPNVSHVLTVPSDTPFLPTGLVERLQRPKETPGQLVLAASSSGVHYVAGLWPIALAAELERDLRAGHRKASQWTAAHGAVHVRFPDAQIGVTRVDPFFNINTPGDLALAEAWIGTEFGPAPQFAVPVFGIVGWKNSGKTTLTVRLVEDLRRRGYRVATVKCAHHGFSPITAGQAGPPRDTSRHVKAGANPVAFMGPDHFGIVAHESGDLVNPEPASENRLRDLQRLVVSFKNTDVVLVEGFKAAPFAKIEVRSRSALEQRPIENGDAAVVAVASDAPRPGEMPPQFSRDDVSSLARIIISKLGLKT